jgi:hypothetical protein
MAPEIPALIYSMQRPQTQDTTRKSQDRSDYTGVVFQAAEDPSKMPYFRHFVHNQTLQNQSEERK